MQTQLVLALVGIFSGAAIAAVTLWLDKETPQPTRIASEHFAVRVPEGWSQTYPVTALSGLDTREAIQQSPGGDARRGRIVVGIARTSSEGLLAAGLARDMRSFGSRTAQRLGALEGLHYERLDVAGEPAAGEQQAAERLARSCGQVAADLELRDLASYELAVSDEYAKALERALGPLRRARERSRAELATANLNVARIPARALHAAYKQAEASMRTLDHSPQFDEDHRALTRALRATRDAHQAMAYARRADAFNRAASAADAAERRLNRVLTRTLRRQGYAVDR